jgi:hypothetical protein
MKMRIAVVLVALSASTVILANAKSKAPDRDPFAKPTQVQLQQKIAVRKSIKKPEPSHWEPNLLATIVSEANSIANIDGTILKLGQHINGYRLIEVARYSATFQKNGKKYKFDLYKKEEPE